jgi:hypothetical protein
MAKNYMLRFKCPHGDADEQLILRNREETLEQVQNMAWHFECPVHGVQQEIPIETKEIVTPLSPEARLVRMVAANMLKPRRRSKRLQLRIPVAVCGRNSRMGTFREETETHQVNSHGGLVTLAARVGLGETFLVVNKATEEEQQCRVVYVGALEGTKKKVGFSLLLSAPNFWRINFPLVN